MDFLVRFRWTIALALVLLVSACVLLSSDPPLQFSHALHVEQGLDDCTICHNSWGTSDSPGMPTPQICRVCHFGIDAEKPPEKRVASLFDANANFIRSRKPWLPKEVRFSHQTHTVNHKVECADCHGDMTKVTGLPRTAVRMELCTDCHSSRGFQTNCDSCHREITKQTPPATHLLSWVRNHGDVVRRRLSGTVNRCDLCHDEVSSCQKCHKERMPESHTNYWRTRGHGVMTSMDRSRCATCHRSDACTRCHQATRPRSHRPGFGSPQLRHCTSCHFPLRGEGCITCHKGTPSHALASPLPANHNPAMNCRQCHGVTVILPHPDGGTTCTTCHR